MDCFHLTDLLLTNTSSVLISEIWADNVKPETIIFSGNATIKDARVKTIFTSGEWKLEVI